MIWRKNIVALFLAAGLALSCPSPAGAQQNGDQKLIWASRSDANAPGIEAAGVDTASNVDAVYHDKETKTIDLFFRAWDGNRQFWDFDETNLVVKEVVGEDTLDLPVVFQGRVSDTTLFGAGEVFQVKTQSERDYHREKRTYLLTWRSPDPNQKEMLADISVQKNWSLLTPFSLTRQLSFWDLLVLALFILAAALALLVIGVSSWHWYIDEISALFIAMGVAAAIVGKLDLEGAVEAFKDGARDMITAALVIGLAKGLIVIAEDGRIIDTILNGIAAASEGLPQAITVEIMFIFQTFLNFFVPSGSGQAALTMPIMAPLSDLLGISRQTAVLAFQFGDGLINMIIPTSGVTMGILAVAKVPYNVWIKWFTPLLLILIVACMLLLLPPLFLFSW